MSTAAQSPTLAAQLPSSVDERARAALEAIEAQSGIRFADYRDSAVVASLLETWKAIGSLPLITLRNWLIFGGLVVGAHIAVFVGAGVPDGLLSLVGLLFAAVIVPMAVAFTTIRQLVKGVVDHALGTVDQVIALVEMVMGDVRGRGGSSVSTHDVLRGFGFGVFLPILREDIARRVPLLGRLIAGPLSRRITAAMLRDATDALEPGAQVVVTGDEADDETRRSVRAAVGGFIDRVRSHLLLPLTLMWVVALVPFGVYMAVMLGLTVTG